MQRDIGKMIYSFRFLKGYVRIVLPVMFVLIFLFTGCSEEDTLNLPLKTGEVHVYSGKYKSKGGIGNTITLTAEDHRLTVEREYDSEDGKRYLVTFNRGEERLIGLILMQQDDGLYAIFAKKAKSLLLPTHVKSGQSWKNKSGSRNIVARIGGRKTFETGLGKLEGREISFTTNEGNNIKLWLNDTQGIIAIHYSFVIQGSNRTEADLILKKVETLEKSSEKSSEKTGN